MLRIDKYLYQKVYRAINPIGYARSIGVTIGRDCRLIDDVTFGSEPYLIFLGNHVSATATTFITHDGGVWLFRDKYPDIDRIAPIRVGNNVFLGYGTIILPGVTIGDNVIVGAGSIVTKDIPFNTVYAGIPARFIKTIDAYWDSVKDSILSTKKMDHKEKRDYLLKHFSIKEK